MFKIKYEKVRSGSNQTKQAMSRFQVRGYEFCQGGSRESKAMDRVRWSGGAKN
jgi:hypothetical protein